MIEESHYPTGYSPIEIYLSEVRRYPMLTREEEYALAIRSHDHNEAEAARTLVTSHLRYVIKVALENHRRGMTDIQDLVQEGNLGLMRSVESFDPYRGVRLLSYATYWIRAYILRFIICNRRLVKVGSTENQRKLFFRLPKERARLEAIGSEATAERLARILDVEEEDVIAMSQVLEHPELPLTVEDEAGSERCLLDFYTNEEAAQEKILLRRERNEQINKHLKRFLRSLHQNEARIFRERTLAQDPKTLRELGEDIGISRERVRQIEGLLLNKLRKSVLSPLKGNRAVQTGYATA